MDRRRSSLTGTPQPAATPSGSGAVAEHVRASATTPTPIATTAAQKRTSYNYVAERVSKARTDLVNDLNSRLRENIHRRGGQNFEFLAPKMSSFVGDDEDDGADDNPSSNGAGVSLSPIPTAAYRGRPPPVAAAATASFARGGGGGVTIPASSVDDTAPGQGKKVSSVADLFGADFREITELFTPARVHQQLSFGSFSASPSSASFAGQQQNNNNSNNASNVSFVLGDSSAVTSGAAPAAAAAASSGAAKAKQASPSGAAKQQQQLRRSTSPVRQQRSAAASVSAPVDPATWDRLSALPRHVQDRVRPAWRSRVGAKALREGEDIGALRPSDRLRVLRHDPLVRKDFRRRVAHEQRERTAEFRAQMAERLDRQRETDISVACAAVARQTDKIVHDEDEGRGPGFGAVGGQRGGGKGAAPSGRIIRQYFEHATREMQIWRRAQRLSTVEERGKQLQHSRDLKNEEELMQTEKAADTRAGETELEIRQNFFFTAAVLALTMIEWHGRVLDVLNPKTRSVKCIAIRLLVQKTCAERELQQQQQQQQQAQQKTAEDAEQQQQRHRERYQLWKTSHNIPANACMYRRTQNRLKHAAGVIMRAWQRMRHGYFEGKKRRSAVIIRAFMKDMGKVLSFTVACRRLRKICRFVQHHWRGRIPGREARSQLLELQLATCCVKEIEQMHRDIDKYKAALKAAEKEMAGRRGAAKLAGAESSHRVIADMSQRIVETGEYVERLLAFRENDVAEVAWKWTLRLVAEYDHKLVRYVHAFARYRVQAGIPHGTYNFVTQQAQTAGVPKPTRPYFRRLLPEEDVRNILLVHCGAPGMEAKGDRNATSPSRKNATAAASSAAAADAGKQMRRPSSAASKPSAAVSRPDSAQSSSHATQQQNQQQLSRKASSVKIEHSADEAVPPHDGDAGALPRTANESAATTSRRGAGGDNDAAASAAAPPVPVEEAQ